LSGSVFALNSDLIERVDATPDTVITLVDGKKYVARESLDAVVAAILSYRGAIIAESARLVDSPREPEAEVTESRHLSAVPLPTQQAAGSSSEDL
jgi:flagellar protein FlbD